MARLKVYGSRIHTPEGTRRVVMAATRKADLLAAVRVGRDFVSETQSKVEVAAAMDRPGELLIAVDQRGSAFEPYSHAAARWSGRRR